MQSRYESVVESCNKVLTGYVVMLLSQFAIFPLFNIHISVVDDFWIALYFSIIGLVRNYAIRRFNNIKEVRLNLVQTKKQSLYEQFENIAIGYFIAVGSQLLIFPYFNIHITFSENLLLSFYFSLISVARGYLIRRYYVRKNAY